MFPYWNSYFCFMKLAVGFLFILFLVSSPVSSILGLMYGSYDKLLNWFVFKNEVDYLAKIVFGMYLSLFYIEKIVEISSACYFQYLLLSINTSCLIFLALPKQTKSIFTWLFNSSSSLGFNLNLTSNYEKQRKFI